MTLPGSIECQVTADGKTSTVVLSYDEDGNVTAKEKP
jgi:hypothetical protein